MKQMLIVAGLVLAAGVLTWFIIADKDGGGGGDEDTGDFVVTKSGLKYRDINVGKGKEAKKGDTVLVHYTGKLRNGKKFDSSEDRNEPFPFELGAGDVIKGWDEGVAGMKVGGKRKLIIPPDLGYGARGAGKTIPPNAELHFDVELLQVK